MGGHQQHPPQECVLSFRKLQFLRDNCILAIAFDRVKILLSGLFPGILP